MKQTLVEKAKSLPRRKGRTLTEEEVELVLAWLNDEVSIGQVIKAIGATSGASPYVFLAIGCKQIWREANRKG